MDPSTHSNVIIGSKLALAMSLAIGSPVRRVVGTEGSRRRVEFAKMEVRCEALKNRSLSLLEGMKGEDTRIVCEAASLRNSADRGAVRRIGKVMGKMLEQQISLHSQMGKLLDTMMLEIRGGRDSKF